MEQRTLLEGELRLGAVGHKDSARRLVETGKRLVLLQAITPRGEFVRRVGMLGFERRTVWRAMRLAKLFGPYDDLVSEINSATKLDALAVLDSSEIDFLARQAELHGITLAAIKSMTTKELHAAVQSTGDRRAGAQGTDDPRAAAFVGGPVAETIEGVSGTPSQPSCDQDIADVIRHAAQAEEQRAPGDDEMLLLEHYLRCDPEARALLIHTAGFLARRSPREKAQSDRVEPK